MRNCNGGSNPFLSARNVVYNKKNYIFNALTKLIIKNKTMKKLLTILTITGLLFLGTVQNSYAAIASTMQDAEQVVAETADTRTFHQILKQYFIDGTPIFMGFVLITLILGLAIAIERIIYLNMATTNTDKLMSSIEEALSSGGVEAAKEVARNTKGPVASIFYQGLDRMDEGVEQAEKSIVSYGGVQMGLLEKNVSWLSLFIALAPMLGFMGTVIGMIGAFEAIANAGDISPAVVAVGIKVALLTTVFGLVVAIILQIFYNYIISKIDSIVNNMENSSISLVDMLIRHKK